MSSEHPLRIGFLIHDVSRLRRTVVNKVLRPLGITRSQSWVLVYLSRHLQEGMTQTELAVEMEVGKVTLGGLVDRLEESGYVKRIPDPSDRRIKRVFMTKAGNALIKQMQKITEEVNAEIMKGMSEKDIETTENTLHAMKKQLLSMDAVTR